MIGKITTGKSSRGALRYIHSKEGALSLESNLLSDNWESLPVEFDLSLEVKSSPSPSNYVYHVSLSIPSSEDLSSFEWHFLAKEYLSRMGFDRNAYSTAIHLDTENQHLHIVANRRGWDGKLVDINRDYYRSQLIIRELEQNLGLTQLQSSWEVLSARASQTDRTSNNTGKLYLMANEVDLPGPLEKIIPADHLYIVYADPRGKEYFVRAGPENSFPFIGVTTGEYTPGTIDWPEDPSKTYAMELEIGDRDAGALFKQIVEQYKKYEKLAYGGVTANCNSAAISALKAVGIEPVLPNTARMTPGLDNDLNANLAAIEKIEKGGLNVAIGYGELVSNYDRGAVEGTKEVGAYYNQVAISEAEKAVKTIKEFLDLHGEQVNQDKSIQGEDWLIRENNLKELLILRNLDNSVMLKAKEKTVLFFDATQKEIEKLIEIREYLFRQKDLQNFAEKSSIFEESEVDLA